MCRSAREKPYLRAAPSEYRVDTANGQDNDDAQTRTGELWASYGRLGVFLSYSVKCFFKKVSEIRRWSSTRYWWLMPELR